MQDALGYYQILQLNTQADTSEIKRQYRDLAKIWHPDYNKDSNALEVFQKLSIAYEVLSDDKKRLVYDLLSSVYGADNFPDLETIQPFKAPNTDSADIRVMQPQNLRGQLWRSRLSSPKYYCTFTDACRLEFKSALLNWLLGWWSISSFGQNIKVLRHNYRNVDDAAANLRLLIHNTVAYFHQQKGREAAQSAIIAMSYAQGDNRTSLQKFLTMLQQKVSRPKAWNFKLLKVVQLVFPALIVIMLCVPPLLRSISGWEVLSFFQKDKEINYYQEVNLGRGRQSVDDVVVGKILNIPVDRSDNSKLYYVTETVKIMHGPSEDFDVLKELPARTTVRLTGLSPDNIWARIMIDSGEMGFVRFEDLSKGIGKPVPEFSKVATNK